MIIEEGDKILIVYRRLFKEDETRYFVGVADGYELGVVKVSGYSWIKEPFQGKVLGKNEIRTKIFSISSGTLIVYLLPSTVDLKKLRFESQANGEVIVTDGPSFKMNLTEKGGRRASLATR